MQEKRATLARARDLVLARLTEIILGALLSASIAAFAFVLASHARLDDRVRVCEQETTRNTERIEAASAALQKAETSLIRGLEILTKHVDQRCDSIEQLLNIIVSAMKNKQEEKSYGLSNSEDRCGDNRSGPDG